MTPLRLASLVASLLVIALAAPAAHAQDQLAPRVLVIPLTGKGAAPAHLTQLLVQVASERGARVATADTGLAETALLVGCDPAEATCLDAMATALNVDHLLFGTVTRNGKGKRAVVELTVTARQHAPAKATVELPDDGADEAFADEARKLLAVLDIEGRAAAAEPGPAPTPEPAVEPAPAPPAPAVTTVTTTRPDGGHVAGWTWAVIGTGAALAIAGGVVWAGGRGMQGDIDAAPTRTAADLERLRQLEDDAELRLRAGGGAAIAGVAIAATGAVIAVLQRRGGERATVAAVPAPGGFTLTVQGSF